MAFKCITKMLKKPKAVLLFSIIAVTITYLLLHDSLAMHRPLEEHWWLLPTKKTWLMDKAVCKFAMEKPVYLDAKPKLGQKHVSYCLNFDFECVEPI